MQTTQKQAAAVGMGLGMAAAMGAALLLRARTHSYDFSGRTVLITGGARGLGLVLARQLAAEGARLGLCSRSGAELERAAAELRQSGGEVFFQQCDVADQQQVERWVESCRDALGPVDVLINNAGVIDVGPLQAMTVADFERAMGVHFWGPVYTCLAVLPEMRRRGEGRIVNVSSIGGKIAVPHLLPYCASKFALVGLSEGLRAELARDGVAVTTVCPGTLRTGSHLRAHFKGDYRAEFAWFAIVDSLPGTSMPVERAAAQILNAVRRGDAEVVLGGLARAAALMRGICPGFVADLMGLANRVVLPVPAPNAARMEGRESRSPMAPTWVTTLSDRAAERNNELG